MTDNTARKKVPLPPGYVVPRPQQPPPLRRRESHSTTGVEVVTSAVTSTAAAVSAPAPVTPHKSALSDPQEHAVAFREAMATLAEDEDKTTAFQVPEELLRRSRTGMPGSVLDEERGPDSGAVTAPPPPSPEAAAEASEVKLGVPGMPKDLDVSSYADEGLEETEGASEAAAADDEEHSGEFTRINKAGELEALIPVMEKQELTHTSVRKRQLKIEQQPKPSSAAAVLWVLIGTLSAAGAILASMVARG